MKARPESLLGRRHAVMALGLLCTGSWAAEPAAAKPTSGRSAHKVLPASASLRAELERALAARQPLVVMVSLHGCVWCDVVRNNYLAPMHVQDGLHVVQVDARGRQKTETVAGEATTHGALVRDWQVKAAPTLLFLGADGREVADRLVGGSPDFYAGYLDQRLEQARSAVQGKSS